MTETLTPEDANIDAEAEPISNAETTSETLSNHSKDEKEPRANELKRLEQLQQHKDEALLTEDCMALSLATNPTDRAEYLRLLSNNAEEKQLFSSDAERRMAVMAEIDSWSAIGAHEKRYHLPTDLPRVLSPDEQQDVQQRIEKHLLVNIMMGRVTSNEANNLAHKWYEQEASNHYKNNGLARLETRQIYEHAQKFQQLDSLDEERREHLFDMLEHNLPEVDGWDIFSSALDEHGANSSEIVLSAFSQSAGDPGVYHLELSRWCPALAEENPQQFYYFAQRAYGITEKAVATLHNSDGEPFTDFLYEFYDSEEYAPSSGYSTMSSAGGSESTASAIETARQKKHLAYEEFRALLKKNSSHIKNATIEKRPVT